MDLSSVKWWRVVDPLNPLCGCDVVVDSIVDSTFAYVSAIRKLDVLMGDRPWQLRNPEGNLGVAVDTDHLQPSPVQDEIVEIGYDRPWGKCLDEQCDGGADAVITVVTYENAIQIALAKQPDGEEIIATCTITGEDREQRAAQIRQAFLDAENIDELAAQMRREEQH